jgi:DedD protein
MTFVMDERLKHRLVGVAVILSIAAIFAPAIMKKSNHRFDGRSTVSIKLPAKPALPVVAMPEKESMFRSVKVAHVDIPSVKEELKPLSTLAKAEPLSQMNELKSAPVVAQKQSTTLKELTPVMEGAASKDVATPAKDNKIVKVQPVKAREIKKAVAVKGPVKAKIVPVTTSRYSVQLAAFSQQNNAVSLVNRLKSKGYKAFFSKTITKNGTTYKVLVGAEDKKQRAETLQQQLAEAVKLKGIVVPTTGIS